MSLRQKYLNVVSKLITPGALGVAMLLGSAAPGAASQEPAAQPASAVPGVSERLAAIRDAVSAVTGDEAKAAPERHLAWGNWGWGGGWGWGRPWGNFGGPWHNWNNWRNGWNNWGNGWGNW